MNKPCFLFLSLLAVIGCSKAKQDNSGRSFAAGDASSLMLFQQDDRFGYKNITGIVVIKPQFSEAGEFSEGLARVKPDQNGTWGYINADGDMVITPQYQGVSDFSKGKSVISNGDKFLYINPKGTSIGEFDDSPPQKDLSVGDTLYVIHPNGLIARALGDINAAAMGRAQFGEAVRFAYDPHPKRYEIIDGLRGTWLAVRYQGKQGYLFDVFLSRYPQTDEKRTIESYRVVVSGLNNDEYSVFRLSKYLSGGWISVHEGPDWTQSQEIVLQATIEQVIARLKLVPTGEVGTLVTQFNGESTRFTADNGASVVMTVQRDAGGFFDSVIFSKKSEEMSIDVTFSRYSIHDVEIGISTTTPPQSSQQDPS